MKMIHAIPWTTVGIVFQAFLTLVIAGLALLIQRQQAETNRRQYRLALFEKRMKVYDGTVSFILDIGRDPDKLDIARLRSFWQEVAEQDFLFGPDVKNYLDEIFKKGNELRARVNLRSKNPSYDRETELLNWFFEQRQAATESFCRI